MKINVFPIIRDHWLTLYSNRTGRISIADISIFVICPMLVGILTAQFSVKFGADAYNASITFFGILIALLLNIQVAIFGIFLRKWPAPANEISRDILAEDARKRRIVLGEVNTNISYLIVFGTAALTYFLIVYVLDVSGDIATVVASAIYVHFLATFLMIVKRAHALFQKEYVDSPE